MRLHKGAGNPSFDVRMLRQVWPTVLSLVRKPTPGRLQRARSIIKTKLLIQEPELTDRLLIGAFLIGSKFDLYGSSRVSDSGKWGACIETSFKCDDHTILLKILTRYTIPNGFFKGALIPSFKISAVDDGHYGIESESHDQLHEYIYGRKSLSLFFKVGLMITGANGSMRSTDGALVLTEYGDTGSPGITMSQAFPGFEAFFKPIGVPVGAALAALNQIK